MRDKYARPLSADEVERLQSEYAWDAIEDCESEQEMTADLVDNFMGDSDSEDSIIEIIANNADACEAVMELCCHRVSEKYVGEMSYDKVHSLARAATKLIKVIEGHAQGYIK